MDNRERAEVTQLPQRSLSWPFLFFVAILSSLLLSIWKFYLSDVIVPDGICYLTSAAMINQHGLSWTVHHFKYCSEWPFYALLIAWLVHLTHHSYFVIAAGLNIGFAAIAVGVFVAIVRVLGGTQPVCWLGLGVILLAYSFNSTRDYIIRDHGYWASYLLSIYALLHYSHRPNRWRAVLWTVAIGLATLFRVEGIVFLCLLPLLMLALPGPWVRRCHVLFTLLVPSALGMGLLVVAYWVVRIWHPLPPPAYFLGRLPEVIVAIFNMGRDIAWQLHHMQQSMLGRFGARDAWFVFPWLVIGWYGWRVIGNVSLGYFLLASYAIYYRQHYFKPPAYLVLAAYLCINVAITLAALVRCFFLDKRYLIALSLTLMLFVPFALSSLLLQYRQRLAQWLLFILAMTILLTGLGGLIRFGYSKAYIREAGTWLRYHVPTASICFNNLQLFYYAKPFPVAIQTIADHPNLLEDITTYCRHNWQKYHYLALLVDQDNDQVMKSFLNHIKYQPLKIFANKRGDQVRVYTQSLSSQANNKAVP